MANILLPRGVAVTKGTTIKFPSLANTLETIANFGVSEFYNGSIAHNLINDLEKLGGNLTLDDLSDYTAKVNFIFYFIIIFVFIIFFYFIYFYFIIFISLFLFSLFFILFSFCFYIIFKY